MAAARTLVATPDPDDDEAMIDDAAVLAADLVDLADDEDNTLVKTRLGGLLERENKALREASVVLARAKAVADQMGQQVEVRTARVAALRMTLGMLDEPVDGAA